ncbi:MAG: isocitrate dehydrogenase kinase/phosphatase AceK regulatory subunit [Pseudoxanthomonas sp.]
MRPGGRHSLSRHHYCAARNVRFGSEAADVCADHLARFADVTRHTWRRFETRDWAAARIELYDQRIGECMLRLEVVDRHH